MASRSDAAARYRSDGIISGNLRIDTGGRRMWVGNMEVRIEEYCTMMEPINNVDIAELVVIPKRKPGYMKGVVNIPFEFDLGRSKWKWNESYHGHTFGLHHNITVQLDRPWYTFDIMHSAPVTLERISP